MRLLLYIIPLGLFCAFASFCHGKYGPDKDEGGYDKAQVRAMADFVAFQLQPSPSKLVHIWRNRQAAAIASVYNLTPETLDSTVDVRRLP